MCNCGKNRVASTAKPKPVVVAFPDGTKKSYDTETAARVAAASKGGKLVAA